MLLGIDLGGTKVAYTLADSDGQIRARRREPTPGTGAAATDVDVLVETVHALCAEHGGEVPTSVGLCVPGPLDQVKGLVIRPPNLAGWTEVPIAEWLEDRLGCGVHLENDANAGALAEWRYGAGRGVRDLVYLTMSTGVGAGLIVDGHLYRGRRGTAGEMGHVAVEWPGEPCACGLHGCLEAYVGGRAWSQHLRATAPESARVIALAGAREHISPEYLLAAAREGDAWACEEMERFNHYLARGIAQLVFMLAPERVVLGTIVAAAGEELCLGPLREEVARLVWPHQAPDLRIVAGELGDDLPHRSAIAVAINEDQSSRTG